MMWMDLTMSCCSQFGMVTSWNMVCRIRIPAIIAPINDPMPRTSESEANSRMMSSDPRNREVLDFSRSTNLRVKGTSHNRAMMMTMDNKPISISIFGIVRSTLRPWRKDTTRVTSSSSMTSSTAPMVMMELPILDLSIFNSSKISTETESALTEREMPTTMLARISKWNTHLITRKPIINGSEVLKSDTNTDLLIRFEKFLKFVSRP